MSIQPVFYFFYFFGLNCMLIKIATYQATATQKLRDLCSNQFLCSK